MKDYRLRMKQQYAIEHLRCMLAEDLRNAGVVDGWEGLKVDQLVSRLYGSFLDSHLLSQEFREFYGHAETRNYRDPFPEGHDGPIPLPQMRWGVFQPEPHIPAGYMEAVEMVQRDNASSLSLSIDYGIRQRRGVWEAIRYRLANMPILRALRWREE